MENSDDTRETQQQQHQLRQAIEVPREAVGFIIGRHGETVRSLSSRSGALIAVDEQVVPLDQNPNQQPQPGVFNITGTPEQVRRARQLISEKVNAILFHPTTAVTDPIVLSPTTPASSSGATSPRFQHRKLPTENAHARQRLSGAPASSMGAAQAAARESNGHTSTTSVSPSAHQPPKPALTVPPQSAAIDTSPAVTAASPPASTPVPVSVYAPNPLRPPLEMWIPANKVGMVIGQKGQVIGSIQDKSGATIVVHNQNKGADGSKLLTITGEEPHRQVARTLIERVLARDRGTTPGASATAPEHTAPISLVRLGRAKTYVRPGPSSATGPTGAAARADRVPSSEVAAAYSFAPSHTTETRTPHTQPFAQLVTAPPPPTNRGAPFEMTDPPPPHSLGSPPSSSSSHTSQHPVILTSEQGNTSRTEHDTPSRIQPPLPPPPVMAQPPYYPQAMLAPPYPQVPYPRAAPPHSPAAAAAAASQQAFICKPVCVPTSCVGIVIGKGGETIRDLQSRSGAYIKVTPDREAGDDDTERSIFIMGPYPAVELAHNLLNDIVNEGLHRNYRNGAAEDKDQGDTSIASTSQPGPPPVSGTEVGAPIQPLAIDGEYRVVAQTPTQYPSTSISIELSIPNAKVGVIIGKGGQTIRELQQKSGARIVISKKMDTTKEDNPRLVTITGPAGFVEAAHALITAKIRGDAEPGPVAAGPSGIPTPLPPQRFAHLPPGGRVPYFGHAGMGAAPAAAAAAAAAAEMHALRSRIAQQQAMHQMQLQQQAYQQQALQQQALQQQHAFQQQAAVAAAYQHQHHQLPAYGFGTLMAPAPLPEYGGEDIVEQMRALQLTPTQPPAQAPQGSGVTFAQALAQQLPSAPSDTSGGRGGDTSAAPP